MEPTLNRAVFEVTSFDSAAPAGAAAVVHRFKEAGQFVVSLYGEDGVVDTRVLSVEGTSPSEATAGSDSGTPSASSPPRSPVGVVVDVSDSKPRPGRPAPPRQPSRITMGAGGYASFTAPPGRGNRAVVRRAGGPDTPDAPDAPDAEFDIQKLGVDDLFAVTLVRPGTYALRDTIQGAEGRVVVTYPVVSATPYRPADPVEVSAEGDRFSPDFVTLGPGQGLIIRVRNASRITVDLLEPDDGPNGPTALRPKGRWRPQRRPGDS